MKHGIERVIMKIVECLHDILSDMWYLIYRSIFLKPAPGVGLDVGRVNHQPICPKCQRDLIVSFMSYQHIDFESERLAIDRFLCNRCNYCHDMSGIFGKQLDRKNPLSA